MLVALSRERALRSFPDKPAEWWEQSEEQRGSVKHIQWSHWLELCTWDRRPTGL